MSKMVNELPLISLRGMTILPYMVIHFDVSRKKSVKSIEYAMMNGQKIFLAAQKSIDVIDPVEEDVYEYGTISEIKQIVKMPGGLVRVTVKGLCKAKMLSFDVRDNMLVAEVEEAEGEPVLLEATEEEARIDTLRELMSDYYVSTGRNQGNNIVNLKTINNLDELIYRCMAECNDDYEDRQEFLSEDSILVRYDMICDFICKEMKIEQIKRELTADMKARVDKHQKEYILREQIQAIREELGDTDYDGEIEEFKKKAAELDASDEVRNKILKDIKRYSSLSGNSSESYVLRSYIDTVLELPWGKMTEDNNDIKNAAKVLDADHYGLKKVKERIIEFLAVRVLTDKGDAPIICLVGPPGTGKTSIAASVARALNRKYVRICLGGVRDEAEIRGHRKTYVGAMPGRIIEALQQAGVSNPLMLLDEIDKVGNDRRGDTASALLEILDSAQNKAFRDHYIEVPFDLSEVLFIATANDVSEIPKPLLDRMEIVEINSYTQVEKFHIAKEHLVPKQIEKNGLKAKQISFSKDAVNSIIEKYTREAGVRELERCIGKVCRKAAKEILTGEKETHKITAGNLKHYLGTVKYDKEDALKKDEVGVVRGLAWTAVGGTTLDVEASLMQGKGEITLTGQLGDVMKESAMVSLGYIRSVADKYKIDKEYFENKDVHIHIPEGAVPKDGPSAGITMTLALLSAYTGRPVNHEIAMTGEITLHGHVLPIGGLKEKLLAAKNAGAVTVLVPDKNRKDIDDMEAEITEGLEIIYVKKMDDVVKAALK